MDSNKSPSAPGWDDEKSSMIQNPPPPYHDQTGQAHPQQGYGYPEQQGVAFTQQPCSPGQQYQGQPAMTVQPTVYMTQGPLQNPVKDYLGYSIFTMICCCMPCGIAALIYSILAREANHTGDRASAERKSRTARILNHVALGLGLCSIILCIIYAVVVVFVTKKHL